MAQSSSNKGSSIRTYGDPVLAAMADEITNIDGKLVTLAEDMFRVMYQAPGLGLAGPQIGVQKQIFVYDVDDDPQVIINPKIVESSGEWVYDEGCLSIPGLYVEMLRPKKVLVSGYTLEGEEVKIEADELLARLFQHEIDHLQGVLMFDRMLPDQRELAIVEYAKVARAQPMPSRCTYDFRDHTCAPAARARQAHCVHRYARNCGCSAASTCSRRVRC